MGSFDGIKACVFDAYGTLFDIHAPTAAIADELGDKAAEWLKRLDREATILEQLDHENVVTILEAHVSEERAYIVMEYVEGGSLRGLLDAGPVPQARAGAVLRQVGAALEMLHSRGFVHRDLKPENVLLELDGRVKVADFGLAARIDDVGHLTQTGQVLGTADYLAPEQKYRLPVDERADQYALAVMAYEVVTGRKPLGRFQRPSERNQELGSEVDSVLLRGLQEDPDDRFEGIAEFNQALADALGKSSRRGFVTEPWLVVPLVLLIGLGSFALAGKLGLIGADEPLDDSSNGDAPRIASEEGETTPQSVEDSSEETAETDDLDNAASAEEEVASSDDDAAQAVVELTAEERRQATNHLASAGVFLRKGKFDECIEQCDLSIAIDPSNPQAFFTRAYAHGSKDDREKALADLDQAIELKPDFFEALHNRALYWMSINEVDKALADLDASLLANPEQLNALLNRAKLHTSRNNIDAVFRDLEAAFELDHENGVVREELAFALATAVGDRRDAERALRVIAPVVHSFGEKMWRPNYIQSLALFAQGYVEDSHLAAAKAFRLLEPERRPRLHEQMSVFIDDLPALEDLVD